MKTFLPYLMLFLAMAGFSLCRSNHYTMANLPAKQIRWGHGGGFTGVEKSYILLENGQIFKQPSVQRDTLKEFRPGARANVAKKIFEQADSDAMATLNFMHPGNVYLFIEIVNGDKVNRISWGDGKTSVPVGLQDFYNRLQALLPEQDE